MKSQITMKDIAGHFGISLNTVHKAIYDKPGVGETTRKRILDYADANGYRLNTAASLLKTKKPRIVICLPQKDAESRYFYDYIWEGCRAWVAGQQGLYVEVHEIPYRRGQYARALLEVAARCRTGEAYDGLLTAPPQTREEMRAFNALKEYSITTVFVMGDNPKAARLGAVMGDYYAAGRIMAEQTANLLRKTGKVLLMAGDPKYESHALLAEGFTSYLKELRPDAACRKLIGDLSSMRDAHELLFEIQRATPGVICCVFARGSALLAEALHLGGLAGRVPVIANDLNAQSVQALREGTFTNLVYKDPAGQARRAMEMLGSYLTANVRPAAEVCTVGITLIFKSNVDDYWGDEA